MENLEKIVHELRDRVESLQALVNNLILIHGKETRHDCKNAKACIQELSILLARDIRARGFLP